MMHYPARAWSIRLRACAMPSVPVPPIMLTDVVARWRPLAAPGAEVVPIGEDPAAHGHWCTFTDLYHATPCHATQREMSSCSCMRVCALHVCLCLCTPRVCVLNVFDCLYLCLHLCLCFSKCVLHAAGDDNEDDEDVPPPFMCANLVTLCVPRRPQSACKRTRHVAC